MIKVHMLGVVNPVEHSSGTSFDVRNEGHLFVYSGTGVDEHVTASYAPGIWTRVKITEGASD